MTGGSAFKLVLWVEGVTDASISPPSEADGRVRGVAGALVPIVRRALQRELAIPDAHFDRLLGTERIETEWIGAKLRDARHRPGRFGAAAGLSGRARKLMITLTSAQAREPDAMVIAVWDGDTRPENVSDRDEIVRALRASRYEGLAVGVCIEEVEAWLLADAGCFRRCFGSGPAKLPGSVEALPDPKGVLDSVLKSYPELEGNHLPTTYRRLAEESTSRSSRGPARAGSGGSGRLSVSSSCPCSRSGGETLGPTARSWGPPRR